MFKYLGYFWPLKAHLFNRLETNMKLIWNWIEVNRTWKTFDVRQSGVEKSPVAKGPGPGPGVLSLLNAMCMSEIYAANAWRKSRPMITDDRLPSRGDIVPRFSVFWCGNQSIWTWYEQAPPFTNTSQWLCKCFNGFYIGSNWKVRKHCFAVKWR